MFVAYLASELWTDPDGLFRSSSRSESNAINALLGTVIIGLPALSYAVTGPRFEEPWEDPEDELDEGFVPDEEHPTREHV